MDDEVNLPRDIVAEQVVLGALMMPGVEPKAVWAQITPADFFRPAHADLAALIQSMNAPDPVTVWNEVRAQGGIAGVDAPYLHTLISAVPTVAHASHYAAIVAGLARRRRLIEACLRGLQMAQSPESDLAAAAIGLMADAERLSEETMTREAEPAETIEEFLEGPSDYDWLLPGLLERGDRLILTGYEGLGKSHMLRQMAVAAAAGVHPFDHSATEPITVLLIDLENGRAHMRRQFRPLVTFAESQGRPVKGRLRIVSRPSGIDVARSDDEGWLYETIRTNAPDLLVIGPLYRMHAAELSKEDAARQVVGVLDRCRTIGRCALIVEAHSGHGESGRLRSVRPIGSSLFMRWPEFGYGLKPHKVKDAAPNQHVTLVGWRGARDERDWPRALRRGSWPSWPWVPDVQLNPGQDSEWSSEAAS